MTDRTKGPDEGEATRRLTLVGANQVDPPRTRSVAQIVLATLREPMFGLLLVASGLYLALGDLAEGLLLTLAAVATIVQVVFQEARGERALQGRRARGSRLRSRARPIRIRCWSPPAWPAPRGRSIR